MAYAEVILPLPLHGTFTYLIPGGFPSNLGPGHRVVVPLGTKKIYTGIVFKVHDEAPSDYHTKELLEVLDTFPVVNQRQLDFFRWISNYYMCSIGEVINMALPSALKLSSQSYIGLRPDVDLGGLDLNKREWELLASLKDKDRSMQEVSQAMGLKQPQKVVSQLADKGLIDLFEKVKDRYQSKKTKRVRLAKEHCQEESLKLLFEELGPKPKQLDVLLAYLRDVHVLEDPQTNERGLPKSTLLAEGISASSLKTLIKNQVLVEWEEVVSRFESGPVSDLETVRLSDAQHDVKQKLKSEFQNHRVVLLHGITGSGKTEIYMELAKEQLVQGNQVLYLLPEIALTTQIIARLHRVFGNTFGVYHSRYSDNERVEIWKKVLNKEYQFVVGARSAVFLPFENLGLIIVDEEHEPSYKQFDTAPRYHARDAATYLATIHRANVLLGTATPSSETYQNALDGKFGLVTLEERYGPSNVPTFLFADLTKERKQRKMKGHFSSALFEEIEKTLEQNEQVILFQNRRGYASYVSCENCAYIPKCPHCAVSLTYHQFNHKLVCHYCGHHQPMVVDCTNCGSNEMRNVGYGTEELEEEIKLLFPTATVQRMDLDTTRNKYGYQRIIEEFEEGNIDILVGTQMVSKGLDFDKVNLVGIFDTDRMIHFPDFRSHERAYHLIVQVSGRAGRKSTKGKVIIQTNDPMQPLLQKVRQGGYNDFFQWDSLERQRFGYPPFCRLIRITFKHQDKKVSLESAIFYAKETRKSIGDQQMTGPVEPLIGKIRNQYLHEITLKIDKKRVYLPSVKKFLLSCEKTTRQHPVFRSVGVVFDVDPM